MKERQKRMLRLLLTNRSVLRIDDIATAFGIGKRTVSRDLDGIEQWLSLRGAVLERKPNSGIQVLTFSREPEELLRVLNTPDSFLESISTDTRQKLIFVYLVFNNREIKISEIAQTFFISDTTVWNDLNALEKQFRGTSMVMERLKGVGIRLTGDEGELRLEFLRSFSELFSSRTIIPYLYSSDGSLTNTLETNQFRLLMERIKFPGNSAALLDMIAALRNRLGYQFTMSGETLLYFYLQISIHRIKSGGLILSFSGESRSFFETASREILQKLTDRIFCGILPDGEIQALSVILQVLEIGDLLNTAADGVGRWINPAVKEMTGHLIDAFGDIDNDLYYLDDEMTLLLAGIVDSLVLRLKNHIPYWHGDWGTAVSEIWNRKEKEEVLIRELEGMFNLQADPRDLEYLLMYFQSLVLNHQNRPEHKLRCMVCCFEGIGLASYLQSRLNREFHELHVVEATAVYKLNQSYLNQNNIDLVLSTYQIPDITTPNLTLSLPLDQEQLKKDIDRELYKLRSMKRTDAQVKNGSQPSELQEESLSFNMVWKFIDRFSILECRYTENLKAIIEDVSTQVTDNHKNRKLLVKDFLKREELGALFFEEFDVRVLHCKSAAVSEPSAGIITFPDHSEKRMLYLVAPDPCSNEERRMLSEITMSFMENPSFRNAVLEGSLRSVRKSLMGIYREFV